ncbi:MFS transporter [Paraburkholderia guartelaensis]|uniref:MFS transporter n=1 Tax=Paraburkholderia guartelaensis TaxID=2546446 RepID=A0A4R5LD45_9BURK|nr:MFS transporter [Paraburkholderia guartelaensis]TDG06290.1 MFS transporter [Paraburkholderia guartelaensis]
MQMHETHETQETQATHSREQQRRVLWATSISYVVVILDTSIVNVALERIGASLAGGVAGLQWVVNAYTLTFASLLLSGGTLGDRLGARQIYMAGLAVFTAASALCGAAPSLALLTLGRVLQGVGAALLVPASMAIINGACANARERAAAFGVWAGLGGVAMAAGPLLGGVLIGLVGWRSIFLLNVPVCLAGIVMAARVAPQPRPGAPRRLDLAGQAAAIAALALLNAAIIEAPAHGWRAPLVAGGLVLACGAAISFVALEKHCAQPMLPLGFFRDSVFTAAVLVSMISAFTFYGLLFGLSLYLQQERGYTPLRAGLAFLPLTVVVPLGSLLSRRAVAWLGPRALVALACLLAGVGYLGAAVCSTTARYDLLALPLPAIGFAASLITPAATAALMATVDQGRAGVAAGVLNAARQTGAALGVAVAGAMIAGRASIGAGMRVNLLIAAVLSAGGAWVWWRAWFHHAAHAAQSHVAKKTRAG